jgi:hypothetical protein
MLLGRSPIKISSLGKLTFGNVAYGNVVHAVANLVASHDDLLLLKNEKTPADYRDDPPGVKGFDKVFYGPNGVSGDP